MNKKENKDRDGSQILSHKQMRIAAMAPPFNAITGADFKKMKKQTNN